MLKVRIGTENAAFDGNLQSETIRCLKDVIDRLEHFEYEANIFDINGNNVGSFKLTK